MRCHLPYCDAPEMEFQGPNGDWFLVHRAIAFDGWLLWKHALPDRRPKGPLPEDLARNITELAQRIHLAHQQFSDYRLLVDSPFTVSRWWDPSDETGEWSSGRSILCRVNDFLADEVQRMIPKRLELGVRICSKRWLEISLPAAASPGAHSLV
ncbi:MAG: hypothetical protein RLZZ515_431 [Cyanobacteriota bacterium]|jgi:hypothetical protein